MADVDQSLDVLDLSVAVFDRCAWWSVEVVVRGRHSVYCALRHGRHLGSGVDNCINVALLPYGGLHCMLLLADAFGKGSCPLCTGFLPLDMVVSMADLVSGAADRRCPSSTVRTGTGFGQIRVASRYSPSLAFDAQTISRVAWYFC